VLMPDSERSNRPLRYREPVRAIHKHPFEK
jgi:hypothetical protein